MRLKPLPQQRIWGTIDTEPWFPNPEGNFIGEVWFDVPESCPLLVKFLFTSDNLSVQVHPGDRDGQRGKTEMWHVVRADEGAQVAVGVKRAVTIDELRAACSSRAILDLLRWVPARAGDTFFIPAGTVHALGAGLVVCEIQQNSDCTYRLYDFERGRELHLDEGLAVSTLTPYEGRVSLPLESEYFRVTDEDVVDCDRFVVAISGQDAGQTLALRAGVHAATVRGKCLVASAPGLICDSVV